MADYDWFSKTPDQYRAEQEHSLRLKSMHFAELGYPNKQLVCTLCGSVVYGKLDEQWAILHRSVCKRVTPGKHRRNT